MPGGVPDGECIHPFRGQKCLKNRSKGGYLHHSCDSFQLENPYNELKINDLSKFSQFHSPIFFLQQEWGNVNKTNDKTMVEL